MFKNNNPGCPCCGSTCSCITLGATPDDDVVETIDPDVAVMTLTNFTDTGKAKIERAIDQRGLGQLVVLTYEVEGIADINGTYEFPFPGPVYDCTSDYPPGAVDLENFASFQFFEKGFDFGVRNCVRRAYFGYACPEESTLIEESNIEMKLTLNLSPVPMLDTYFNNFEGGFFYWFAGDETGDYRNGFWPYDRPYAMGIISPHVSTACVNFQRTEVDNCGVTNLRHVYLPPFTVPFDPCTLCPGASISVNGEGSTLEVFPV